MTVKKNSDLHFRLNMINFKFPWSTPVIFISCSLVLRNTYFPTTKANLNETKTNFTKVNSTKIILAKVRSKIESVETIFLIFSNKISCFPQ